MEVLLKNKLLKYKTKIYNLIGGVSDYKSAKERNESNMVETIKLNRLKNIDRAYNGINQEEANKQRDRIDRKISFKELKTKII